MKGLYNSGELSIYIFNMWMLTTFMDRQLLTIYQRIVLDGRMEKTLPPKK